MTLFLRNSQRIVPTRDGDALYAAVDPFVKELGDTLGRIANGRATPNGRLRIGAPQELGSTRVVLVAAALRKRHPGLTFELTLGIPTKLLAKVVDGSLDMAFVDNGDEFEGQFPLSFLPALTEVFVLSGSKAYVLEHLGKRRDYGVLAGATFVDYVDTTPVAKMWFRHHFRKAPTTLASALVVENVHGVLAGIRGHMGLGVVPEYLVRADFGRGRLVRIDGAKPDFVNRIMVAIPNGRKPTVAERLFIDAIVNVDH